MQDTAVPPLEPTPAVETESGGGFIAALIGFLLVFLRAFTLPWCVLRSSFALLAQWGKDRRLPSDTSDFPVITYIIVDLKPYAVITTCLIAVLAAIPSMGVSLLVGYLIIPLVSYSFEIAGMFIAAVNSLKKLEEKA